MDDIEQLVFKYALQNAVSYSGKATPGAVIGKVLAEKADLKGRAKEIGQIARRIVEDVNRLSLDEQRKRLEEIAPELLSREKKERGFKLPELNNVRGEVVMRFAPNPSGPLHIGHSRVVFLNDEYVKRYGGRYINRYS